MRLEDFIKSEGISPTVWAKRHGFSQPTISRLINGKRNISLKIALKIQEVTKGMVRVDELVNGDRENA